MLGHNCLCRLCVGNFQGLRLFLAAESPRTLTRFGWRLCEHETRKRRRAPVDHTLIKYCWDVHSNAKERKRRSLAAVGDLLKLRENKWLRSKGECKRRDEKRSLSLAFVSCLWQDWIYLCSVKVLESICTFLTRWCPHDLTSINTGFTVHSPESAQMMVKSYLALVGNAAIYRLLKIPPFLSAGHSPRGCVRYRMETFGTVWGKGRRRVIPVTCWMISPTSCLMFM